MPTHSRKTILLATDQQRSVLSALDEHPPRSIAYTPYGHRTRENGLLSLLGFNGELPDPLTGCYHLGKGYRQFNPVLMRFNSPDSWSPFGKGGLNAYGYCGGEPVLRLDRNGHQWGFIKAPLRTLGFRTSNKLQLANRFNSNPSNFRIEPTTMFSRAKPGSHPDFNSADQANLLTNEWTASMEYLPETNKLYINRSVVTNKFYFTTKTRVNSKLNTISPESLNTITPNNGLKSADPETYQWTQSIIEQTRNSPYLWPSNAVKTIRHPAAERAIQKNNLRMEKMRNRKEIDEYKNSDRWEHRSAVF